MRKKENAILDASNSFRIFWGIAFQIRLFGFGNGDTLSLVLSLPFFTFFRANLSMTTQSREFCLETTVLFFKQLTGKDGNLSLVLHAVDTSVLFFKQLTGIDGNHSFVLQVVDR